jgi:hypothetical protein
LPLARKAELARRRGSSTNKWFRRLVNT